MTMGRRTDRAWTPGLWIAANALPPTGGHLFYQRLNHTLDALAFDDFVEAQGAPFFNNGDRAAYARLLHGGSLLAGCARG